MSPAPPWLSENLQRAAGRPDEFVLIMPVCLHGRVSPKVLLRAQPAGDCVTSIDEAVRVGGGVLWDK